MSLFTSPREKRLWLWAAAVVVVIYSTLGLARQAVMLFRGTNLLRVVVAAVLLGAAAVIVARMVRRGAGWRELLVAGASGLIYLAILWWMERPEERLHLLEYGVVAALVYFALVERRENGRSLPTSPALMAILITAALGWIDEGIQELLPSRVYDLRDVAFNAAAGVLAVGTIVLLERVRGGATSTDG
jgi:hypothetical protein